MPVTTQQQQQEEQQCKTAIQTKLQHGLWWWCMIAWKIQLVEWARTR